MRPLLATVWAAGVFVLMALSIRTVFAQQYCGPGQTPVMDARFASLADRLGSRLGKVTGCQHVEPATGDIQQPTSSGLLYLRQNTNTPTFTDGSQHWALRGGNLLNWATAGVDPPPDARVVATASTSPTPPGAPKATTTANTSQPQSGDPYLIPKILVVVVVVSLAAVVLSANKSSIVNNSSALIALVAGIALIVSYCNAQSPADDAAAAKLGNVELEGRTYDELNGLLGETGKLTNNAPLKVGVAYYDKQWFEWRGGWLSTDAATSEPLGGYWWMIRGPFQGSLHGIKLAETPEAVLRRFGGSLVRDASHTPESFTGDTKDIMSRWSMFKESGKAWIGWTTYVCGMSCDDTNKIQTLYFHQ